jgi:hypothetical protein
MAQAKVADTTSTMNMSAGRRRLSTVASLLLVILAVSVVRSPAEFLARVTSEGPIAAERIRVSAPPGGSDTDGTQDARGAREAGPGVPAQDGPARPVLDGLVLREVRGGWRVAPGVEEAAALALLVGHAWRPASPAGGDDVGGTSQLRIVVIEAVEQPGPGAAVITLLIAPEGLTGGATVHRVAVPVLIGEDGAALGGSPWELPPPVHGRRELSGAATDDPDLLRSARLALDAVGLDGSSLIALEATDGWPFIARTVAGPHPWLRWHVDRFVVTGLPLHRAAVGSTGTTSG